MFSLNNLKLELKISLFQLPLGWVLKNRSCKNRVACFGILLFHIFQEVRALVLREGILDRLAQLSAGFLD